MKKTNPLSHKTFKMKSTPTRDRDIIDNWNDKADGIPIAEQHILIANQFLMSFPEDDGIHFLMHTIQRSSYQ